MNFPSSWTALFLLASLMTPPKEARYHRTSVRLSSFHRSRRKILLRSSRRLQRPGILEQAGLIIGDRPNPKGLDVPLQDRVCLLRAQDLDSSVEHKFPQKGLGQRHFDPGLQGLVLERGNGERGHARGRWVAFPPVGSRIHKEQ